ncbi:E3 ubiquitin-protein ligase rnf13 [Mortierella sp. AM989]|nr:E3 ubiquitin-protein ligase rnf13 [Mortierella sp. AM989]
MLNALVNLPLPVNANLFGAVFPRLSYDLVNVNNPINIKGLEVVASGGELPVGIISKTADIPNGGVLAFETGMSRSGSLLTVFPICPITLVTQGVLYDMGFGCNSKFNPNTTLPTPNLYGLPKIALIQRGGLAEDTECSFRTKMLIATRDGAIAAIVYNSPGMGPIDGATAAVNSSDSSVSIPGTVISYDSGLRLRALLQQSSDTTLATNSSSDGRVRIDISTDSNMPVIWEIILIVVVSLLVALHFRLYTLRRRYRAEALARGAEILPNGRIHITKTLEKSALDEFPVRVFGQPNASATSVPAIIVESPMESKETTTMTGQPKKLEVDVEDNDRNGTETCQYDNFGQSLRPKNPERVNSFSARSMRSVTAIAAAEALDSGTNTDHPTGIFGNDNCAICIEEFAEGDQIRTLPCHHEYHCECIDPWLTSKSSTCPLCKYECKTPATESQDGGEANTPESGNTIPHDPLMEFVMGPHWFASRMRYSSHGRFRWMDSIGGFFKRGADRVRGRSPETELPTTATSPSTDPSPEAERIEEIGDVPLRLITPYVMTPYTPTRLEASANPEPTPESSDHSVVLSMPLPNEVIPQSRTRSGPQC